MAKHELISNYYNEQLNGFDVSIFKIYKEYFKNEFKPKDQIHVTVKDKTMAELLLVSLTFSNTLKQLSDIFEINFKAKPKSISFRELPNMLDRTKSVILIIFK